MGNSSIPSQNGKIRYDIPMFNPSKLQKIQDCPPFTIWKDAQGKLYQLYKIFTSRPLNQEIAIYQFRKTQQTRLVKIIHYSVINRQFDSSGYHQLQVFTERIPSTLSQIQQIPFQNGLQILIEATEGFETIFKHSGCFDIDDNLIGFNTQGKVKVWINSNWSLNSKSQYKKKKSYPINEHQFIEKLILIIEKHIELSSLYVSWISNRKTVKQWSFTSLKTFIVGFIHNHKLNFGWNPQKPKGNQKQQKKQLLFFKSKSNSPNNKSINVSISLGNDRNILKPLLISKQINATYKNDKFLRVESDACMPHPAAPAFLTFKNRSKNKNKTFKHSMLMKKDKPDARTRRKSQQIGFSLQSLGTKDHKRMSSNQGQILQSGRSMMFSCQNGLKSSGINYTITVSNPTKAEGQKHNSSLENIRKQLRNYLGSNTQLDKFRTSSTGSDVRKDPNLKQSREFQFKNVNMKKKKKKQESFKLKQPTSDSPLSNLRALAKKVGSVSRQKQPIRKDSPQHEVRTRVKSISHVPTNIMTLADCRKSGLACQNPILNKPRMNFLQQNLRLNNSKPTTSNLKYTDQSTLTTNSCRPDASTITILSNTKRFQQSILMPQQKTGNSPLDHSKSFKLGSLKGKSVMTQSISVPSSKQKMQIKRQDLPQLKLLDQIVFKSNITKNKNEQDLDISLQISEGSEIKRTILEIQQQCN